MNYRNIAINELAVSANQFDKNSIGQIIFSVINMREDKKKSAKEWLFEVSDEDFFTALEKARTAEAPEVEFFNKD